MGNISQKNFEMSAPHTDIMELRNKHQNCLPPDFSFGNKCPLGYSTIGGVARSHDYFQLILGKTGQEVCRVLTQATTMY